MQLAQLKKHQFAEFDSKNSASCNDSVIQSSINMLVKVAAGPLAVHETENAIKIIMPSSSTKNYVGRILGPRGATLKAVRAETGCTVCIRGRGSIRNKEEEERRRGTFGNEHLEEPLHVLVRGL
jgi:hypothetical protein